MGGDGHCLTVRRILGGSFKAVFGLILEVQKRGKLPTIPLVCGSQSAYMRVVNRRENPLRLSDFFYLNKTKGRVS